MKLYIFDIETNGLIDTVTQIHCLSYVEYGTNVIKSTNDLEEIKKFFSSPNNIFVGHNIIMYDLQVINLLLGIKIPYERCIDTLALCWYLYPKITTPGLEYWGEYFLTPKVSINDWENLTIQDYINRCKRDVEINHKLWVKQWTYLTSLYENKEKAKKLIKYLSFKLDCIVEQEKNPLKLDIEGINNNIKNLESLFNIKSQELESIMPKVATYKDKTVRNIIILDDTVKPTKYVSSEKTVEFNALLVQGHKLIEKTKIKVFNRFVEPNSNSNEQKKELLFSLGWKPLWYKESILKDGTVSKSPQINSEIEEGELCESVKTLIKKEPKLESLEGMGRISHRLGVLKGFLKNQMSTKPGYIQASISGITNTLRVKHKNVVNLVGKGKDYWEMIRGAFICEDNKLLCGSDLSQLEDNTKRHYIYPYDPEYVKEQMTPDYDAHLAIGVQAKMFSQEDTDRYKKLKKTLQEPSNTLSKEEIDFYNKIEILRKDAKVVNFAGIYGAGPPKIAATLKKPLSFAKNLHKAYWDKNWSVKAFANDCEIKTIEGQKWIYNPVSSLWYFLRAEKDRFSTVNQSTAVYVFDTWVKYIRENNLTVQLQYHDEILFSLIDSDKEKTKNFINESINKMNKELSLNVRINCDVKFGENYKEVH